MNEDARKDDKALFAQYCAMGPTLIYAPAEINPLLLAAWIDGRLDETEAANIEASLAVHPALLDDVLSAARPIEPEAISSDLLSRLQGLVLTEKTTASILAYRPRARGTAFDRAGKWLSWGAIAASLLLVSAAGLGVGVTAGQGLMELGDVPHTSATDMLDSTSWLSDEVG